MTVNQALGSMSQKEAVKIILAEAKPNTPNHVMIERLRTQFNISVTPTKFSVYKSEINAEKRKQGIQQQQQQLASQVADNIVKIVEEPKKEDITIEKLMELNNKITTQYDGGWEAFIKHFDALQPFIEYMKGYYMLRDAVDCIRKLK